MRSDYIRDRAFAYYMRLLDQDENPADYEFVISPSDLLSLSEEAGRKDNPFTHVCGMALVVEPEAGFNQTYYARKRGSDGQRTSD